MLQRILALDCGTKTGWAMRTGSAVEWGVQDFSLKRGESPGMRFLMFRSWLAQLLSVNRPDMVIYEQAHHRGGFATELCVGLTTRVEEEAAARGIPYAAVHTGTLKKFAVGKGNANKAEMIAAATEYADGRAVETDDEADALCLLRYAQSTYGEDSNGGAG